MTDSESGSRRVRVRQHVVVSKKTGDAEFRAEVLPDASFAERLRQLKASVPEIGEAENRYASLRCDGCGAVAALDFDDPQLPDGWQELVDGDFCPDCVRGESEDA